MLVKFEARKNLPGFQILMFCNCVFLVFILAKWHRVLGTRQSDVRDINRGSLSFPSWPFNFPFRRSLHKAFSCKSRERNPEAQMSSNSVSMHLWYIVSFVLTLPLTRLPYEFFCLPYISHFVSFENLVLIKPVSFHVICPCPHLIPVCLTITYWYWYCEEKIFFGHLRGVQEQNKGNYIL